MVSDSFTQFQISIHALRVEGDSCLYSKPPST